MKKTTIIAFAIVATMFASCASESTSTPSTDSTAAQVDSTVTADTTTAAH